MLSCVFGAELEPFTLPSSLKESWTFEDQILDPREEMTAQKKGNSDGALGLCRLTLASTAEFFLAELSKAQTAAVVDNHWGWLLHNATRNALLGVGACRAKGEGLLSPGLRRRDSRRGHGCHAVLRPSWDAEPFMPTMQFLQRL